MGLLKAGIGALSGVLADSWREYFVCESLDNDVLVAKGEKKTSGRSSNTKGCDNVISNGSIISVNEGQCAMIVEGGKIVEFCAESGEFVYDTGSEPSIFYGSLGENIKKTFAELGKRFTFGGEAAKDQRVYYFNTKEIMGNKYGTASPVPFRIMDTAIGFPLDIKIRCHGEYSYRITNPMLFYTNVCANIENVFTRDEIDSQLKSELLTALQPALFKISQNNIYYAAIPAYTMQLADELNNLLSSKWRDRRGVEIVEFGVSAVNATEEDEAKIAEYQRSTAMGRDSRLAMGHMLGAQATAMVDAANNESGAMTGFMGMGMATSAAGGTMQGLFDMAKDANPPSGDKGWKCSCGKINTGKFCTECGNAKAKSKFCTECGAELPDGAKFCSECGFKL